MFSDTQVNTNSLSKISLYVEHGQDSNIFAVDEKATLIDGMRSVLKGNPKLAKMSNAELMNACIDRMKDRLHLCLAFSPIGNTFRERLRKFPALINCCTIDWFYAWPKDALLSVSEKFCSDLEMDDTTRSGVVESCQFMHETVRELSAKMRREVKRINYVTPTSYLELIRCFKDNLAKCRDKIGAARSRYAVGLEKLASAASQVADMKAELQAKLPVLAVAKKDTDELMAVIQEKLPGVQELKSSVSAEAATVQKQADSVAKMKKECEDDLAEAIPLLNDAMKALTLKEVRLDE